MNVLRVSRMGARAATLHTRQFSVATKRFAEGDTGATRSRGVQGGDAFTRREKAAEDMYIKSREKEIVQLLREKIAKQEEQLAKDLAMLAAMEDQYGQDQVEKGQGGQQARWETQM